MGYRNSGWNIRRRIRMINCQENIWTKSLTSISKHVFRNNNSGCISLWRIDICIERPYEGILHLFCLLVGIYKVYVFVLPCVFLFLCHFFFQRRNGINPIHTTGLFLYHLKRLVFWCFKGVSRPAAWKKLISCLFLQRWSKVRLWWFLEYKFHQLLFQISIVDFTDLFPKQSFEVVLSGL